VLNDVPTTVPAPVIISIIVSQALYVKLPKHAILTTAIEEID